MTAYATLDHLPGALAAGLRSGTLAPFLGPELLALCPPHTVPAEPPALAAVLTAKNSVPGKIKNRLTQAAQFIENFKHRKTLVSGMNDAFKAQAEPSPLHRWLAALPAPVIVSNWYDDTMRTALLEERGEGRRAAPSPAPAPTGGGRAATGGPMSWAEVQGLSQSEHFGTWTGWYAPDGSPLADAPTPTTVLYKPWGGHAPAGNYLVSDSDYVEVLTEIDIQTPIPAIVQARRASLGFVFLGCRFNDQLPRAFARQIMKRSAGPHYAVMSEAPTRMEARFFEEQGITLIALPLAEVAAALTASTRASAAGSASAAAAAVAA